jgi:hypothetical protein
MVPMKFVPLKRAKYTKEVIKVVNGNKLSKPPKVKFSLKMVKLLLPGLPPLLVVIPILLVMLVGVLLAGLKILVTLPVMLIPLMI